MLASARRIITLSLLGTALVVLAVLVGGCAPRVNNTCTLRYVMGLDMSICGVRF